MSGSYGTMATGFEWNFYETMEEGHMTNNPSEGANNRLASRSGTAHPGFYQFCNLIGKEVENTKTRLEQFEEANDLERDNSRSKVALRSRIKFKSMLEEKTINLRKYLRAQGRLHHKMKKGKTTNPRPNLDAEAPVVRGALVSVTEEEEEDGGRLPPARGRGGRPRGAGRARGVRGRGAQPTHRDCPDCGTHLSTKYLPTHRRLYCPGAAEGEEEGEDDPAEEGEEESGAEEEGAAGGEEGEGEAEEDGDGLHVDQVLQDVQEVDQTVLGRTPTVGGGAWAC